MALSRIALDEETRAIVDQIQAKTRTTSPSAAIALLVSRYGRHLLETWELRAAQHPESSPAAYYGGSVSPPPPSGEFMFSEPMEGF